VHRSQTRFLTTHTGSLIRPQALVKEPPADAEASTRAEYERSLTAAVADVVTRQAQAGLDVVNDGEFGKSSWSAYALGRLSGFEIRKDQLKPLDWLGRDRERFRGFFTGNPELPAALTGAPAPPTSAGRGCGSRRSTTRWPGSRKTGSATTSASAAGTSRTSPTRRWRRSSTSSWT
jgi:hypothetical protein